jgi:REP element-mobilizing transposase RayT
MPTIAYHLVAHALPGLRSFRRRDEYVDAWRRLRAAFPRSWACALMPDHVHLLARADAPAQEIKRHFAEALGKASQVQRRRIWAPIPEPGAIPDHRHFARTLRYILLNPCRERLAADPLQWEWSTHRDMLGTVLDPWVTANEVAKVLRSGPKEAPREIHRYVSSDPTVSLIGTPFPRAPGPEDRFVVSLRTLTDCIAQMTRAEQSRVFVRGTARVHALQIAWSLRCFDAAEILDYFEVSRATAARAKAIELPTKSIAMAKLILADSRLNPTPSVP